MGATEVTQGQYQAIMGTNPSHFKGATNPVETVSWNDAAEFCEKLSQKAGRAVRLPTNAEWEYACRAGTTTPFFFGASEANLGDYAWYSKNSGGTTHPVGQKKPNAWGLYDTYGNVWEMSADWYGDVPKEAVTDPQGPASGKFRAMLGGSFLGSPQACSSVGQAFSLPESGGSAMGFRVVVLDAVGLNAESQEKSPAVAVLPCGIKVDLVGVAEKDPKTWGDDPAHTGTWWQPDGSPLAHTPSGKALGGWTFAPGIPNLKSYKMLARITWPDGALKAVGGRGWPRWFIDPPMDNSWAYTSYATGAFNDSPPKEDLQIVGISIPDSAKTAAVSLSIPSGPWQTVAAMSLPDRKLTTTDLGVEFLTVTENPTTHATTVNLYTLRVFDRKPWQLVAVDAAGRTHVAGDGAVRGGVSPTTFDVGLAQIKEIQFQVRPVETVTFENVSLSAGPPAAGTPPLRTVVLAKLPPPSMAGYRSVFLPSLDNVATTAEAPDNMALIDSKMTPLRAAFTAPAVLNLATGKLEPLPRDMSDPKAVAEHFRKEAAGALPRRRHGQ
jgi:Sulfatase-modifying factor enzyme 1